MLLGVLLQMFMERTSLLSLSREMQEILGHLVRKERLDTLDHL